MSEFESLLSQYDYPIQQSDIASEPASPRDSSKLLVYDRASDTVVIDSYLHLDKYLPKGALLVFNETKVIPARLMGRVATGGKAELLCTRFDHAEISALCERGLRVGEKVWLNKRVALEIIEKIGKEYRIRLPGGFDIRAFMRRSGVTPLPPYLKHSRLTERERRQKYQTIFARRDGSIAAPTASLHFTPRLFKRLKKAGIDVAFITLHVNLGTFMPLTEENIKTAQLHEETYDIPTNSLQKIIAAKKVGRPVIPVGTTALRALESAFKDPKIRPTGATRLFIRESYKFKTADGLITNFHVPRSSLMMLVSALIGRERLLELYTYARENSFRFFSFGDGMLIK